MSSLLCLQNKGSRKKKLTFLAEMSEKGKGNPCLLRKCKFLLGGGKLLGFFYILSFSKKFMFLQKTSYVFAHMSVKARGGGQRT